MQRGQRSKLLNSVHTTSQTLFLIETPETALQSPPSIKNFSSCFQTLEVLEPGKSNADHSLSTIQANGHPWPQPVDPVRPPKQRPKVGPSFVYAQLLHLLLTLRQDSRGAAL